MEKSTIKLAWYNPEEKIIDLNPAYAKYAESQCDHRCYSHLPGIKQCQECYEERDKLGVPQCNLAMIAEQHSIPMIDLPNKIGVIFPDKVMNMCGWRLVEVSMKDHLNKEDK